jgi:uncharacterized protein HemY
MYVSLWTWIVVAAVVVAVFASLRWELADFLLDRFGALTEWWTKRRRERPADDSA